MNNSKAVFCSLENSRSHSIRISIFVVLAAFLSIHATPAQAQGRIDCASLNSKILHRSVRYCVMLPPSYESSKGTKYPVLYFLHGLGEGEQTLLRSGGWGLIEDLRREKRIGDFLLVAPEGRASFFINSADGQDRYNDFLPTEFLRYIESQYHIIRDRKS